MLAMGCSKSDTPRPSVPNDYTPSTTPISFQAKDNWGDENKTKAAELKSNFAKDDNIGVIGYYIPSSGTSAPTELSSEATPNFMYNQKMIYDGANWSYSPIKYWPNNDNDRLQFFAYYPQNDGITLSSSDAKGYPKILFEPAINPHEQVDFMTATSAVVGKEDQGVTFNFNHQLSQVSFQAKHNGDIGVYKVFMKGITLTGVKIYKGLFTNDGFQWDTTNVVKTDSYEATDKYNEINGAELKYGSYTTVTDEEQNGIMLLIPQKLSENDIKIYATFMAKLPTQDNMIEVTQEIVVPKEHEYLKGKKLNYQFTINVKDLAVAKFDKITITDWIDSKEIYTEDNVIL